MPAPPGMSQEEYLILKKRQKEKLDMEAAKKVYKKKYHPTTVAEEIDSETLEQTWMKDGDWGPNWAKVEFVSPMRPIGRLRWSRLDNATQIDWILQLEESSVFDECSEWP
jgi:hypothetical protein